MKLGVDREGREKDEPIPAADLTIVFVANAATSAVER